MRPLHSTARPLLANAAMTRLPCLVLVACSNIDQPNTQPPPAPIDSAPIPMCTLGSALTINGALPIGVWAGPSFGIDNTGQPMGPMQFAAQVEPDSITGENLT